MSNRELVIEVASNLPTDTSLRDTFEKIKFVAGVKEALADSEDEEGISADEVRKLAKKWTSKSLS